MHPLRQLLRKYEWVHLTLGFIGNTCFVVGSVFFLWESTKTLGTWLFIIGAAGMWIGSTGSGIVSYARHKQEHRKDWRDINHHDTARDEPRRHDGRQAHGGA